MAFFINTYRVPKPGRYTDVVKSLFEAAQEAGLVTVDPDSDNDLLELRTLWKQH